MNERLRQLMVQADYPAPEIALRAQKLALLIVQECTTIVDVQKECLHEEQKYWHDRDYGYALAVDDASKGIKQFFGVEE